MYTVREMFRFASLCLRGAGQTERLGNGIFQRTFTEPFWKKYALQNRYKGIPISKEMMLIKVTQDGSKSGNEKKTGRMQASRTRGHKP